MKNVLITNSLISKHKQNLISTFLCCKGTNIPQKQKEIGRKKSANPKYLLTIRTLCLSDWQRKFDNRGLKINKMQHPRLDLVRTWYRPDTNMCLRTH